MESLHNEVPIHEHKFRAHGEANEEREVCVKHLGERIHARNVAVEKRLNNDHKPHPPSHPNKVLKVIAVGLTRRRIIHVHTSVKDQGATADMHSAIGGTHLSELYVEVKIRRKLITNDVVPTDDQVGQRIHVFVELLNEVDQALKESASPFCWGNQLVNRLTLIIAVGLPLRPLFYAAL